MYAPGHISREDEKEIPSFDNHDEALSWFKNKYGSSFQLRHSEKINGQTCYFYYLILNEAEFRKGQQLLRMSEMLVTTREYLGSHQSVEIFDDGTIYIVH